MHVRRLNAAPARPDRQPHSDRAKTVTALIPRRPDARARQPSLARALPRGRNPVFGDAPMIEDDADLETLRQFYSRTPEEIEAKRQQKWNEEWNALRMPEHLARVADRPPAGPARSVSGPVAAGTSLDGYQRALLDAIAGTEAPGYDVIYTPRKGPPLRIPRGADGQPDYSRHPGIRSTISNGPDKGETSDAAGRYQILGSTWRPLQVQHKDLTDFSPANQDKAAWYLASDRYARETRRDLATDLRDPKRFSGIASTLSGEWSSLPGGRQPRQAQADFDRSMAEGIKRYTQSPR